MCSLNTSINIKLMWYIRKLNRFKLESKNDTVAPRDLLFCLIGYFHYINSTVVVQSLSLQHSLLSNDSFSLNFKLLSLHNSLEIILLV